jgi:hypothetical protein
VYFYVFIPREREWNRKGRKPETHTLYVTILGWDE